MSIVRLRFRIEHTVVSQNKVCIIITKTKSYNLTILFFWAIKNCNFSVHLFNYFSSLFWIPILRIPNPIEFFFMQIILRKNWGGFLDEKEGFGIGEKLNFVFDAIYAY